MKILFFSANWCGQCKVIKPKFIDICKQHDFTNYKIIDVDIEENAEIVANYNIRNLPTAIFILNENDEKRSIVRALGFDIQRETELQLNRINK